jgi:hypothetical protein
LGTECQGIHRMKIRISEPDLGSVVSRINSGVIDLQPDFQRGDVWAVAKRKKLIDSIIRGWQVPPIHVIRQEEYLLEVLDGQQRLRAISGFFNNEFPVSGMFEPIDEEVKALHGKYYKNLPEQVKRKVEFYPLRILEVYDYLPGETGELFNRLNQSLNLTAAEKRNAQVGQTRAQIKSLSKKLSELNLDSKFIGFSNTRLAHDDLFARLCLYLEKGGTKSRVSDAELYEKYRKDEVFQEQIYNAVACSLEIMGQTKRRLTEDKTEVHITKASFFSWLLFVSELFLNLKGNVDEERIIRSFLSLESKRYAFKNNIKSNQNWDNIGFSLKEIMPLFSLFNERASSRVMTTSSLLIRDWCISLFYYIENPELVNLDNGRKREVEAIIKSLTDNGDELKSMVESMAESGNIDD